MAASHKPPMRRPAASGGISLLDINFVAGAHSMDGNRRIGGAPLLAVICMAVVVFVFNSSADPPKDQDDSASKIDPSYLTKNSPAPPVVQQKVALDLGKPVQTRSRAIVCDQGLLLEAAMSRSAESPMKAIYDAFDSAWNRSDKVKAAGCEEWREGIALYNVQMMNPPFDEFVGFGLDPNGMAEYFTKARFLKNVP